jgi:hypothetical protein
LVHEHFRRRFELEPGLRAQFDAALAANAPSSPPRTGPTGTDELDVSELRRKRPVPFTKDPDAKPDSVRRRAQKAADERLGKHNAADAAVLARMKAAFQSSAPAPDETSFVNEALLQKPLPFAGGGAPNAALASTLDADRTQDPGLYPSAPALPFAAGAAAPAPLPSPKQQQSGRTMASSEPPLGFTLQRYARLCVDLQASGLSEAQVLAREQITPGQRVHLDAYFRLRMHTSPAERAEWQHYADLRVAELRRGT